MTLAYRMKRRKTRRYAKDFYCDAPITRDPTFTFNLRRNYKSEVEFRWRKVRATVVDAVSRQDMLGTNMLKPSVGSMLSGGQDKIKLFQDWFDRLLAVAVLENDGNWLTPMVTAAYNRGIERAHVLSNSKALPPDRDTVIAALRQFAFVELQGIVEAVSQVAVRSVAEGLINERNKSAIVSGITDAVQKIGVVRSRAMVDTIIVKSFNVASLDQFAAAGLKNVGILSETIPAAKPLLHDAKKKKSIIQALIESVSEEVEVLTAGDDDVCPICEDISMDGPYFIDDAYDLIPAHPHCRCAFVPAEDRRFAPIERDAAHHDANQHSGPAALIRMVHLHKMVLVKARAATVRAADADFSRASMYVWKQGDVVIAGVRDEFDPNEERDPDGKWTTGGGSAAPEEAKSAQSPKAEAKSENERNLSKPLDKREEMALNGYSKNLSQDINKDLRGQERTAKATKNNPDAIVKDYTKAMDSAFDKASTAKDVTTFRAVSARTWEKMQASGEFKDNAFVSTTTSHRIAEKFGKDELKGGHVVVNLDIPKGSKAIYMADKSNHAGEREVLLARGSTWKRGADRDGRPSFTLHSTVKDEWNEEDHPREPNGEFGEGGGKSAADIAKKIGAPEHAEVHEGGGAYGGGTIGYNKQETFAETKTALGKAGFKPDAVKSSTASNKLGRSSAYSSAKVKTGTFTHPDGHTATVVNRQEKYGSDGPRSSVAIQLKPRAADEWNEEDHPRAANGEFGAGGGESKPAPKVFGGGKNKDEVAKAVASLPDNHRAIVSDVSFVSTDTITDQRGLVGSYGKGTGGEKDKIKVADRVKLGSGYRDNPDAVGTTYHEIGHAIDDRVHGASGRLKSTMDDDVKNMTDHEKKVGKYWLQSNRETFAETYKLAYSPAKGTAFGMDHSRASKVFAKSVEAMKKALA